MFHPKLTKKLIIFLQICLICSMTVICFLFVLYLTSEKNQVQEFFVENLSKNEKDRMTDLTTRLTNNAGSARLYDPQIDNYENLENHDATMDTIYIDDYAQEYQKGPDKSRTQYDNSRSDESEDHSTIIRNFNAQNGNVALLENVENIDKIEYFDRIIVDHGGDSSNIHVHPEEAPIVYTNSAAGRKNGQRGQAKRKQKQKNHKFITDNESDDEWGGGDFSGDSMASGDGMSDDMGSFENLDSYTERKSKNWRRKLNRLNRRKQTKLEHSRQSKRFKIASKDKNFYKVYSSAEEDDEENEQLHKTASHKKTSIASKSINTNVIANMAEDSWQIGAKSTTTAVTPLSSSAVAPQPKLLSSTLKSDGTYENRARRIKSNVEKSEEKARKLLLCEESGNYGELCRMLFKGDMNN